MRPERRISLPLASAILALGSLLQATVAPRVALFGATVDLVLLLVVVSSLWCELDEVVVLGLLGGLLLDLFSAAPFGTTVLALGVTAVLASWVGEYLRRSRPVALIVLVPFATVAFDLTLALILHRFGWSIDYPATVALVVLPSCLANLLAAPVVYFALRAVSSRPRPAPSAYLR